mmetsp:Transcript_21218/g.31461  ORF Transcript_21218/g.31461 Transcript_21218/m.31461 type:complete len:279 (+) Transcript_21218:1026-1862(+)
MDHTTIVKLARQFTVCKYGPSVKIFGQGYTDDEHMYFYILVKGECIVTTGGKQVGHGKFGKLEAGTSIGDNGLLFDVRNASVVASKPSNETGTVVVYCLDVKTFRHLVGNDEVKRLQKDIGDMQTVVNQLSGVDTKIKNGTIIKQHRPSGVCLWMKWSGTILEYVYKHVVGMMVLTAILGTIFFAVDNPELEIQLDYISDFCGRLSPLTTFVSPFFLNQAYKFWSCFYWSTRGIQGRFSDTSLVLVSNEVKVNGKITDGAKEALNDVARIATLCCKKI